MSAEHRSRGDELAARRPAGGRHASALGAMDAATLAAAKSTSRFDHAGAARHLTRALDRLSEAGEGGTATHFELLHTLGRAHWRAGDRMAAAAVFDDAWQVAEAIGDVDRMARAALGGGFSCDFSGAAAADRAERCRAALRRLPDGDGPMKARLLADLAASLAVDADPEPARLAASEALEMARRTGVPLAIGYSMVADQFLNQGPTRLQRRIADGREIIALAAATGEHALDVLGRFCLIGALLEAGDPALATAIDAQTAIVRRLREPAYRRHDLWFRCMRALLQGDLDDAEQLAGDGFEAATAANDPDSLAVFGGQISVARWMQGRAGETAASVELMWQEQPDVALWPAVLAAVHAATGHHDKARDLLAGLHPSMVPDDRHTLLTIAAIGETASLVGDGAKVAAAATALLPYADRMIPIAMGVACWGPVARQLGLLAVAAGDLPAAAAHFEAAWTLASRLGATPWIAWCAIDLIEVELALGTVRGDAAGMAAEAAAAAARSGMPHLATRAAAVQARLR